MKDTIELVPSSIMATAWNINPIMLMYSRKKQKVSPHLEIKDRAVDAHQEEEENASVALITSCSTHATYPFPIADLRTPGALQGTTAEEAGAGKRIKKGDLDLLYFQPFVKAPAASMLYKHLLEELPWYKITYLARGLTINTPRYTTVFGLDESAFFEAPPSSEEANEGKDVKDEKESRCVIYTPSPHGSREFVGGRLLLEKLSTGIHKSFVFTPRIAR